MKNFIQLIIGAIILLGVGLGAGYLLFGNGESNHADQAFLANTSANQASVEQIWTCSMHPQIRQNEPGLCPICAMDLIPLEENSSNDPLVLQMTEEAVKLANIQSTVIGRNELNTEKVIHLSGKVAEDERQASSQVAHIPGRIEQLFVTFTGEPVTKGQKLATLYSPDLISAQRELIEALKLKDVSPGLIDAARNKLRFWKIGEDIIAQIENEGQISETFGIYADATGIVTKRKVSVGDYVKVGQPLYELMNLSKVWVLFDAYEEDLPQINLGDLIQFTTPSIPNKEFRTRVTFIDPVINPNTRVASVRTELNNSGGRLKPEMFVNGYVKSKIDETNNLLVPKTAVLWTGSRSVVYVKVPDVDIPSFQFREVEIGESIGRNYLITEGLESGEEVVTNGAFTIDAAAQLNNQASMMNRKVDLKSNGPEQVPNYMASTAESFRKQLSALSDSYLDLKNSFVETDIESTTKKTEHLINSLEMVDMGLLNDQDAHIYWMEQHSAIDIHSQKILESDDIEEQRKQFSFLTEALINTLKAFGKDGDPLYVQYCPMAFDNEGAEWISDVEEIRNPYFGDRMLKCGVVKSKLYSDDQGH